MRKMSASTYGREISRQIRKKEGNLEGEGAEYVDRKEKKKLTSVRTIRAQRLIANSRLLTGRLILASVVESEQQRSCSP
jgi:hypothetical protein